MFKKPFRPIDRVFIHCSASDEASHDNVHTIRSWHVNGNKWADIGYHYLITKDGSVHEGRSTQFRPAAQKGHNTGTIAICLTGFNFFSNKQKISLFDLCEEIKNTYNDNITFHGHREVDKNKTCPNFDYTSVLMLDEKGFMNVPKPEKKPKVTKKSFWSIIIELFKKG